MTMRKYVIPLLAVVWLTGISARAQTAPVSANPKAAALYQQAAGLTKASLDGESLRQATALLEQAAALDPKSEAVWTELAWRYWQIGEYLPKESSAEREVRLGWFEKGQAAGEKAIAINPKSVGGIYWYTVNLAAAAEMKGILSSLMLAGELFGNMSRVDRRDPYFLYGATRRFGSEVLIRVPTFLSSRFGFKAEYVIEDLEWNIERWPNYFDNYVFLARVHWWEGDKDRALRRLEFVLSHDPNVFPEERAENAAQQKVARQLWKEYTGKEYPAR